jgi:hypothetical protein
MKPRKLKAPSWASFDEFSRLLQARHAVFESWKPRNALIGLLGHPTRNLEPPPPPVYSDEIKAHPVYQWLSASPAFIKANTLFARRRRAGGEVAYALQELGFLDALATWAHAAEMTASTGWKPQTVSIDDRRKAVNDIETLQAHMNAGIVLSDILDTLQLERLLKALKQELQAMIKSKKRDYSGDDARERAICVRFAQMLAATPGLPRGVPVEIVQQFAELSGFTIGLRSAQRYMRIARANHKELQRTTAKRLATEK